MIRDRRGANWINFLILPAGVAHTRIGYMWRGGGGLSFVQKL